MPSRTYTGIDLENYVYDDSNTTHSSANGSSSAVLTETSQCVVSGLGSANDTQTPAALSMHSTLQAFISGDFPYNDPTIGIPEGATITMLTIRVDGNGSSSVNVSSGATVTASSSTGIVVEFPIGSGLDPNDVGFFEFDTPVILGPSPANLSCSGSAAPAFEIDLAPGITKAQLIADWGDIYFNVSASFGGSSDGIMLGGGTGSGVCAITFDNFSLTVDYTDPAISVTLTPSSGDVEPGQTITVTGDPTDFTYAGTNDPKIIPIPKKPGEDPKLPVPLPPTEECSECLTACPECDTCYDACMEDLESENCQECLETCIDCLADCLEDEEEAEKCQQSLQDDPPSDIVIIVCDPTGTRFYGSVPLGTFTILVARASGIYRLVDGKTNDTQYATARDGTTYDVAIPTPFAKTGFFRS